MFIISVHAWEDEEYSLPHDPFVYYLHYSELCFVCYLQKQTNAPQLLYVVDVQLLGALFLPSIYARVITLFVFLAVVELQSPFW